MIPSASAVDEPIASWHTGTSFGTFKKQTAYGIFYP